VPPFLQDSFFLYYSDAGDLERRIREAVRYGTMTMGLNIDPIVHLIVYLIVLPIVSFMSQCRRNSPNLLISLET
jgi:hypothetical protein